MIPNNINEAATIGEKKVFKILKDLLPDDYCVWYDVRVNERYPDFIILGPDLGILVLEVKDWQLQSILNADIENFYLSTSGVNKNPLKQARDYMNILVNELKQDKNLIQIEGLYKGNLSFTYGHGVIFTNINKNSFKVKFNEIISDQFVIYGDELQKVEDERDKKVLLKKLKTMFIRRFDFRPLNDISLRSIKNCIGQTITDSELKIIELEMKINNIEKQSRIIEHSDREDNEVKTTKKSKISFISVAILLFIFSVGILFFDGNDIIPEGSKEARAIVVSEKDVGNDITIQGKINDIKVHENGHLIITLEGYEENFEVFINAKEKSSFPNFIVDDNYEFSGRLKEYNKKLQLNPKEAQKVSLSGE